MTARPHPPVTERRSVDPSVLRAWLGARSVSLGPAPATGWSAETIVFEADGRRLVLRAAPHTAGMFAEHDLSTQVRCLHHVRAHGLPAPEVVAVDLDGDHLGRPAYVMAHVAGRVPPDGRPPFTRAGFLHDATHAQQRTFGDDLVDRIAAIHRLPALELPIGPTPADHLDWLADREAEAAHTGGATRSAVADAAAEATTVLRDTTPPPTGAPAILWGDARPSNTIVGADFRVVALLDWELAGWGAPEFDVAWLNEMNRMRAAKVLDPVLPGLPTEQDVWDRWATAVGRAPRSVAWHRLYAAHRIAVLMDLHLSERVRHGELPADAPVRSDNRARRRVAALLAEIV
ncbi:hypothetical protein AD006_32045 (plasmid) [Pseudonocardia sp. EC080610-09]|uniref:phosphotransferase family protein n=1 Tax=unclassified Pseudonocardia TaxID=2619320 RepID=UPI0007056AC8|nr:MULTISPECIES: phosphotransferase family protein [unclassified Pseudonocardia]ALL79760.1 hypothetical protein AD006_32045 [Pseudonocardia sp. EC080610-09]ALL85195.1 hypothetical protein AD017_28575 [Pseudonocardia sp. EC080619-01]